MKYSNKTNIENSDFIGLASTFKELRRMEFTFKKIEHPPFKALQYHIIDLIQSFYLSFSQNQKA